MKFRADRSSFASSLSLMERVARGSGGIKPVYACVHVVAAIDGISITANDLEIKVRGKVIGDVESPGEVVIPAKRLLEVLRECEGQSVDVEADGDAAVLRDVPATGKGSRFKMLGHPPADFPAFGPKIEVVDFISRLHLIEAIDSTAHCAAKEISRYAICGVLLSIAPGLVTLVATDGRRLSRYRFASEVASNLSAVVPLRAINLARKIIGDADAASVGVNVTPNEVMFTVDGVEFASSLVSGDYPKYEEIIPRQHLFSVKVDAKAFANAVRRAGLMTSADFNRIHLEFDKSSIRMVGSSPESGESVVEFSEFTREGDDGKFNIALNPEFFRDSLAPCESAKIKFTKSQSPVVIEQEGSEAYTSVLMPLMLSRTGE